MSSVRPLSPNRKSRDTVLQRRHYQTIPLPINSIKKYQQFYYAFISSPRFSSIPAKLPLTIYNLHFKSPLTPSESIRLPTATFPTLQSLVFLLDADNSTSPFLLWLAMPPSPFHDQRNNNISLLPHVPPTLPHRYTLLAYQHSPSNSLSRMPEYPTHAIKERTDRISFDLEKYVQKNGLEGPIAETWIVVSEEGDLRGIGAENTEDRTREQMDVKDEKVDERVGGEVPTVRYEGARVDRTMSAIAMKPMLGFEMWM
ncbi:hypothetical protein CC78DRAFT_536291 [Lojkania enalia]|uniref:PEBP-like protein n=1 Tax=Lojkania enalia TaxID=147567 RepID=A0A9P4K203_9PLEO|nr:hypothetical protein CC78DRAFT_536291 [Didymosphaeria enalia]